MSYGGAKGPSAHIAVLEIGGTHVTAAVVEQNSWSVDQGSMRRHPLSAQASAETIVDQLLDVANALDVPAGSPWGVAIPGPFDYAEGIALFRNVEKFDDLFGYDLRSAFRTRIRSEPGRIAFVDDAEAFTLGEWIAGSARGVRRCVGLTVGTGIGSGFLADGCLITSGPTVPPGGRMHVVLAEGRPIEELVSRRAILRRYSESAGPLESTIDVKDLAYRARNGDLLARNALEGGFVELGRLSGPWVRRFEADMVVVGGSISKAWDLMAEPLKSGLKQGGAGYVEVAAATDTDLAPLIGAAWAAHKSATAGAPDNC